MTDSLKSSPSRVLTLAGIGCGGRTRTYMRLAAEQAERYKVVAAADPRSERLEMTARLSRNPDFRAFPDADAILSEPKLADLMIIGTQDAAHREHAVKAMEKGYDLLLEKPIAASLEDTLEVEAVAQKLNRRVLVCHVLRYTPFYRLIKEIVVSGVLGDVISLNAIEGVEAWHYGHSYVRGHWAVREKSSPMILAKSCHDLDIIRWLVNKPCREVSSFGALNYFTRENCPEGAPPRCQDGCPVADSCLYNCERYLDDQQGWLKHICDLPESASREEKAQWLHRSPWGRCVYQCDNNVVDHQTVNLRFDDEVTATFTMTAFQRSRYIEIFGTKGAIRSCVDDDKVVVRPHDSRLKPVEYDVRTRSNKGYAGHGGGDSGIVDALYEEMQKPRPEDMTSSLPVSVESHRMAFAAEAARLSGQTVMM